MYSDDHNGDGRLAIWSAAPLGIRDELVESAPQRYSCRPMWGIGGWIWLRLDRDAAWREIEAVIEDAHRDVAPARLVEARWPGPHATPAER